MRHKTYKMDPYWTTGRFGNCAECGKPVKGKRIFYFPATKTAYCEACGEKHARRFDAEAFDEAMSTW